MNWKPITEEQFRKLDTVAVHKHTGDGVVMLTNHTTQLFKPTTESDFQLLELASHWCQYGIISRRDGALYMGTNP